MDPLVHMCHELHLHLLTENLHFYSWLLLLLVYRNLLVLLCLGYIWLMRLRFATGELLGILKVLFFLLWIFNLLRILLILLLVFVCFHNLIFFHGTSHRRVTGHNKCTLALHVIGHGASKALFLLVYRHLLIFNPLLKTAIDDTLTIHLTVTIQHKV